MEFNSIIVQIGLAVYIPRAAGETLLEMGQGFPVLVITGPRQSGKTTLARAVFPEKPYVSLETPTDLDWAQEDPEGFLDRFPDGAILDEVQRCPELFSFLQVRVDEQPKMGHYILAGSQQFGLNERITQSLAGRAGGLRLLPFSYGELSEYRGQPKELNHLLWKGLYPPLYDRRLKPNHWYASYVDTYLERDLRQMLAVRDLSTFRRFLRLGAGRTGQLLNLADLARDAGVSPKTAQNWLSILEASFVVHLLAPYHGNFSKRMVKSPKLYFLDTGLAAFLIGIQEKSQLEVHPLRGELFESWVVSELLKSRLNRGLSSNLYFWRDSHGNEVDLLVEHANRIDAVEVKSAISVRKDAISGLSYWAKLGHKTRGRSILLTGGKTSGRRGEVEVLGWNSIAKIVSMETMYLRTDLGLKALSRLPWLATKLTDYVPGTSSSREITRLVENQHWPHIKRLLETIDTLGPKLSEIESKLLGDCNEQEFGAVLAEVEILRRLDHACGDKARVVPTSSKNNTPDFRVEVEVNGEGHELLIELYTPIDNFGRYILDRGLSRIHNNLDAPFGYRATVELKSDLVDYPDAIPNNEGEIRAWLSRYNMELADWIQQAKAGEEFIKATGWKNLEIRFALDEVLEDPDERVVATGYPTESIDTRILFEEADPDVFRKTRWARKLLDKVRNAQAGPPRGRALRVLLVNFARANTSGFEWLMEEWATERMNLHLKKLVSDLGGPPLYDVAIPCVAEFDGGFAGPVFFGNVDQHVALEALRRSGLTTPIPPPSRISKEQESEIVRRIVEAGS